MEYDLPRLLQRVKLAIATYVVARRTDAAAGEMTPIDVISRRLVWSPSRRDEVRFGVFDTSTRANFIRVNDYNVVGGLV